MRIMDGRCGLATSIGEVDFAEVELFVTGFEAGGFLKQSKRISSLL